MPRALRLLLTPLSSNVGGTRLLFDGARLSFALMGKGLSRVSAGSPVAGKLSLQLKFLDQARAPQDTEQRALASLAGSIAFRELDTPVFTGSSEGWVVDPQANDEAPDAATSQRALRLELATPDFEGAPASQDLVFRLDPERFRFFELRGKLEIGGAVEADLDVSDALDVAITANNPPPLGVTLGVHPPLFDAIPPSARLILTPSEGAPMTFSLASGIDRGDGLLSFLVPAPRPGVLYKAEMMLFPADPATVLFEDFELDQLVAQSNGAPADPLPSLGRDVLAFESTSKATDDEQALQGGPETPSEQQLASFDAHAGTIAVA